MQLTLVRNATLILNYAGQRILVDPFFAPKHTFPSFGGVSENPTVDLPMPIEDITNGVNAVLVTHLHPDHFGPVAQETLDKSLLIACQPGNEDKIREAGFQSVVTVTDSVVWQGIKVTRTGGHHGIGAVENQMGAVSGFVFTAEGEPTLYLVGDSVLVDEVREALKTHNPDVIVSNSGGAMWNDPDNEGQRVYILMDAAETVELAKLAPEVRLVAVHIEALDHCTVTREALRAAADEAGISAERLMIPADGETLTLS